MKEKGRSRKPAEKSGWSKPDGRPMRKRKGEFFPDKEIEGFRKKKRSFTSDENSKPSREGADSRKKFEKSTDSKYKRRDDAPRGKKFAPRGVTRKPTSQPTGTDEAVRLNKFIANTGICSRREADELIGAGVISVNGEVVTELGTKVTSADVVRYNGEPLRSERMVYVLLNKPKDFISTTDDPDNRKTVMNLVSKACSERIYPVGRLDRNTTGLLLMTNDGDLTKKLTHPSYNIRKLYSVELDQPLTREHMKQLVEGVELEDGVSKVDDIAYEDPQMRSKIGVELHSGKNRIVRRLFEELGYQVKKLDRVVFAGLTKKDLPRGRWRMLTEMEVNQLRMMTGNKKK